MASDEIGTLDRASLERFQTELIEAGFEPRPGDPRSWVGPIANPLRALTTAGTMRIYFEDGWPFRNPRLFVEGMVSEHVNAAGEVCLWQPGDTSGEWSTLVGFHTRIAEWVDHAQTGFRPEDIALDAHLYFANYGSQLATINLGALGMKGTAGEKGKLFGAWKPKSRLELSTSGKGAEFEGRWYYVEEVAVPPRDLDAFREVLTVSQQRHFDRRLKNVARGGASVAVLVWDKPHGRNALVVAMNGGDGKVAAKALEVAPTDEEFLKLRAGPDVTTLGSKTIVAFGAGAIGSQAALRLAEAGLGMLRIVDRERLRPGNVVRHAADSWAVGGYKVAAIDFLAKLRAPWTQVAAITESPWDPEQIETLLERADLALETTGFASFTNLLSVICERRQLPLVSSALYRGGAVGRVRRQLVDDAPIYERRREERYPVIPPGDEPLALEPGCSEPVNNASPVAVTAIAALTAEVAIDVLSARGAYGAETLEVYRALDIAPFDRIGRIQVAE